MKKRNLIIILSILLLVFVGVKNIMEFDLSIFRFSISKDVRLKYINVVDETSKGKVQVNWREVAAVDATFNYGQVETATDNNIKRVAERFIVKIDSGYTLGSLESVVKSFGGKTKDVKKAEKYLMVINQKRELKDGYKKDFFESIKKDVISVSNDTGILPSVILGQAALESNWGRSSLASNYNNLFGIKADSSWKGEKVNLPTSEYYNTKIKDDFRVYNNLGGSIKDFGQFLMNNARYKKSGVFKAKTYKEQIIAIENAGYSTITNEKGKKVYADYVTDIIISNDLQVIDSEVKGEE